MEDYQFYLFKISTEKKFIVSPNCFFPKPKVKSLVIYFSPKENSSFKIKKLENLERVTNIIFSNKRKMINKNIRKNLITMKLNLEELKLHLRPENIKPERTIKLLNYLRRRILKFFF